MRFFLMIILTIFLIRPLAATTIDLISYNVDNLFDTLHDEGKNDLAFLPKSFKGKIPKCKKQRTSTHREDCTTSDWTSEKLAIKIAHIKEVIDSYGTKPAILALVEVENSNVVSMVAKALGYSKFFVASGPDPRGIDQALLINEDNDLKVVGVKEYPIEGVLKKTRNHFEVELLIKGSFHLFLYINHWPSQVAPSAVRYEVAKELRHLMEKRVKENPNVYLLSVGDYNTLLKDRPNPFDELLLKDNFLQDISTLYANDKDISSEEKNRKPLGSYFFAPEMSWNLLDRIFVSPNFLTRKGISIDPTSFVIHAPKFATTTYTYPKGHFLEGTTVTGVPWGYDFKTSNSKSAGYSDHFPIAVKINY